MFKKYGFFDNFQYCFKCLWEIRKKAVFFSILDIMISSLKPLSAVCLPAVIVGVLENGSNITQLIMTCFIAFMMVGLLHALASYFETERWLRFVYVRVISMYGDFLNQAMEVDYAYYESEQGKKETDLAGNALSGTTWGVEGFYHHTISLIIGILGLIIYCLLMASVHPLMLLLLIGLSYVQYVVYIYANNYEEKHRAEQGKNQRYQRYLFSQAYDIKSGKDIRLYQLQDWISTIHQKYHDAFKKQHLKEETFYYLYDFVGLFLQFLRDGVCYGYLLYQLSQGLSLSEFVLYLGIVGGVGSWVNIISEEIAKFSRLNTEVGYYRSYVENKNEKLCGKELTLNGNHTLDIVFDNVCFHYPNSDELVLNHLSFHIKPKEKIALVGVNGAGKTTIVKILSGFYKPTSGKVLINGVDLTELNPEKYRDQISVLFQDSVLFSFTIAQNITGKPEEEMDHERLHHAITQSGLSEKIESLEKKEHTFISKEVDSEGIQLSGGQIQQLFLARTIYKNAYMMILDEPTAALDALAESEMYEKYAALVQEKTSIFISHRLSSTRFCDRIFYLENGEIVESGTHEALMAKGGSYAHMFDVQSQYYQKEEEAND